VFDICVWGGPGGRKDRFLRELVHSCSIENLPLVVGGDFNIIKKLDEKNNNRPKDQGGARNSRPGNPKQMSP
jgi:hypothetical protein